MHYHEIKNFDILVHLVKEVLNCLKGVQSNDQVPRPFADVVQLQTIGQIDAATSG